MRARREPRPVTVPPYQRWRALLGDLMEPPSDAVRRLEELHKDARLAWDGEQEAFALLQIYPHRAQDEILGVPWRDKGRIFGTKHDPVTECPMWIASFTVEEVFDMSFISTVRRWMTPLIDRLREADAIENERRHAEVEGIAEQAGKEAYWNAQNVDTGRPPLLAKKFFTKEDKYKTTDEHLAERKETHPLFDRGLGDI